MKLEAADLLNEFNIAMTGNPTKVTESLQFRWSAIEDHPETFEWMQQEVSQQVLRIMASMQGLLFQFSGGGKK